MGIQKWSVFVLWLFAVPLGLVLFLWFFGIGPVTILSNLSGR